MKTALITGVGRRQGLGFEIARQLGTKDFHVIVTARHLEQVELLARELEKMGIAATALQLDLTSQDSVDQAVQQVRQQFSSLNVLINNAAMMGDMSGIVSKDLGRLAAEYETNVVGTWRVVQAFYPLLKIADSPRIVNVTSGSGSFEDPEYGLLNQQRGFSVSAYATTKTALNAMTVMMAQEFASDGILVNAVCPGQASQIPREFQARVGQSKYLPKALSGLQP